MRISWEQLSHNIESCQACGLAAGCRRKVPGQGDPHAPLMLIGEGPGEQEDRRDWAFVGPAGSCLRACLPPFRFRVTASISATWSSAARPTTASPRRRRWLPCPPPPARTGRRWCRPRVILLLGATAVAAVLGPDERITRCRGRWFERKGTHIIATYHPSALLRDPSKKRAAWEDLQSLRQRLTELSLYPDLLKEDRP